MSKALKVFGIVAFLLAARLLAAEPPPIDVTSLGELCPESVRQDWGRLQVDRSVGNQPLRIGDRAFARGLGTHSSSELVFRLAHSLDRPAC